MHLMRVYLIVLVSYPFRIRGLLKHGIEWHPMGWDPIPGFSIWFPGFDIILSWRAAYMISIKILTTIKSMQV